MCSWRTQDPQSTVFEVMMAIKRETGKKWARVHVEGYSRLACCSLRLECCAQRSGRYMALLAQGAETQMAMKRFYTLRPPDPPNARGARLNCWSATTKPAERTRAACGTRNVQAATCRLSEEALDAVASFRFAMARMPKALDVRGFEMNFHELFRLFINSNFDVMTWTEFARVFECHHPTVTKHVMSEIWLRMVPDEPRHSPLSQP